MTNGINSVAVWGDSILKGVVTGGDSKRFELVPENSLALAQEALGFELNNKAVFGNIITKGRKTLLRDLEKGLRCDLGIIEFCGNDCDFDWNLVCQNPPEAAGCRTPLPQFLGLLSEMISALRSRSITPLVMTPPPLVADRWLENISIGHEQTAIEAFISRSAGGAERAAAALYQRHELYSDALRGLAQEHGVQIADMRRAFLSQPDFGRSLMCRDGIHPNLAGYKMMAGVWIEVLPKVKKEF